MPPVNILIKPSSGNCNLRCRYCFYCDEMEKRETANYGFMSEETLEILVKRVLEFADGSGMKVTTARYYTPSGECIHEIGIEPDVEVELDEDAVTRYGINNLPHDHDAQLQKAIELLGGTPVLTTATPDEADAAEEK